MEKDIIRKRTVLIVDDMKLNRRIISDMLGNDYSILEAENGLEAVSILQHEGTKISIVLLDIVMPEMDGLEVLAIMNKQGWIKNIPVIMISTENATSVIERAFALGVTDFIGRPFDTALVRNRVANTIMLSEKQAGLMDLVEDEVYHREKSVSLMVSILSQIVEFRNGESGMHVLHVNTLTELLLKHIAQKSKDYELNAEDISTITMASSLHDIGKIAIPESILNKPGRLTDEEFELMKTHSAVGAEMLKSLPNYEQEPLIKTSYEICRWHHERWDGRGYPDGLKGSEIPISAQVVALADVYDALTSKRVYKDAFTHDKAIEMILNGECGSFNPFLLDCLVELADVIQKELEVSSLSQKASDEITKVVERTVRPDTLVPSSRTLDLLDYERIKFNFFAIMSNEVQFEFTADPPVVTIADYGLSKLGLPETILDPLNDGTLIEMFGKDLLNKLCEQLLNTSEDDPIIQMDVQGNVNGESRWFHLASRAIWAETSKGLVFNGAIGKLVDIHESRQRLTDLERRATHDSLTGLTNHAFARKIIAERMRNSPEDTFVLMVLDMDNFKKANDTYGHLFGDEVLKHLSELLRESVRDNDVVARVGGDEFLICLEVDMDPQPLVDRIYNSITGQYKDFPISLSMGVVSAQGKDVEYDELFRRADQSLYDMKRNGRGGYVYGVVEADMSGLDLDDGDKASVLTPIESEIEEGKA